MLGFPLYEVWYYILNLFPPQPWEWGLAHSGLPILVNAAVVYWRLGYLAFFKRSGDTSSKGIQ